MKYVASCSFGKDSLATVIVALEHGEPLDEVLYCEVITAAQREEIEKQWRGPHSLGISAKSIKKGKVKKDKDGRSVSVYPQGTRKRRGRTTRNAEIAFINEYGAPGRHIAARPAIDAANKKKEGEAVDAGEKVYNAYLDSMNL